MVGIAAQHESDVSLGECGGDVGDTLVQKTVVAQIGVRIKRDGREKDDDRLVQQVRGLNRDIECRIVDAALRALHPVDDASAIGIGRAGVAGPLRADAAIAS